MAVNINHIRYREMRLQLLWRSRPKQHGNFGLQQSWKTYSSRGTMRKSAQNRRDFEGVRIAR